MEKEHSLIAALKALAEALERLAPQPNSTPKDSDRARFGRTERRASGASARSIAGPARATASATGTYHRDDGVQ